MNKKTRAMALILVVVMIVSLLASMVIPFRESWDLNAGPSVQFVRTALFRPFSASELWYADGTEEGG